ncbi:MAG: hypothetical protein OXU61_06255 [Gammaproteobacteria bacterium]|nr:hypothetical protein [Gammaproteobacteria bacterium]
MPRQEQGEGRGPQGAPGGVPSSAASGLWQQWRGHRQSRRLRGIQAFCRCAWMRRVRRSWVASSLSMFIVLSPARRSAARRIYYGPTMREDKVSGILLQGFMPRMVAGKGG